MPMLRTLHLLLLALSLTGCAWFSNDYDETKDWTASKFYSEAKSALNDGDYETAIRYFESLEARYPFGRYALQAQLEVAYAYYRYDEPESAIAAADRFIRLHPRHPSVDYAYYLKGIVNFNRSESLLDRFVPSDVSQRDPGAAIESFKDFGELVRLFPESKYAEDARQRMLYLRSNLARYEIHVARYYIRRGAYLAAANRAKYVIEKYQRTSAVRDALEVLVEAYTRLGMEDLAADARKVLDLNEAKGTFASMDTVPPPKKSLARKLWDYLEFDK